jgi:hypothetical protein
MNAKTNAATVTAAAAIAMLLIMGTSVIPTQSYAYGDHKKTGELKSSIKAGTEGVDVDKKSSSQHQDQDNFCYRGDDCQQANDGQQVAGKDNEASGFNDQSKNLQSTPTPSSPGNGDGSGNGNGTGANTQPGPTVVPTTGGGNNITINLDSSICRQVSEALSNQSISQGNDQDQSSSVVTAGANSPVTNSGNNAATATNTNNGGNAAAPDGASSSCTLTLTNSPISPITIGVG